MKLTIDEMFFVSFEGIAQEVHTTAVKKDWWTDDDDTGGKDAKAFANFHAEISEAWEAWVKDNPQSEKIPEFDKVSEELADVIIRIMDYAERRNLDVAGALLAKMEFNKTRSSRHGGKKA